MAKYCARRYLLQFVGQFGPNNKVDYVTIAGKSFKSTSDYMIRNYSINGLGKINCSVALRYKGNTPEKTI